MITGSNFGERLKNTRTLKGLKQSDVAAVLQCAPTSLTNYESNRINPPFDVLSRLCEVLEISPLELLDKEYTFQDLVEISIKPAYDRTYEEQVALNFSRSILEQLMPAEKVRAEAKRIAADAAFIKDNNLLERFGGSLTGAEIAAIKQEYSASDIDADLLFAFHILSNRRQWAVIDILQGLLSRKENLQPLAENVEAAAKFTADKLAWFPGGLDFALGVTKERISKGDAE